MIAVSIPVRTDLCTCKELLPSFIRKQLKIKRRIFKYRFLYNYSLITDLATRASEFKHIILIKQIF